MPASDLKSLLAGAPVVPVLVIDSVASGLPLARALVDGGLRMLEITLRTPAALDVIRALAAEVEGAVVGAGTVLTAGQYEDAERAGARFVVSPGTTDALLAAAAASPVPFLPGAATASEVMRLLEQGYRCLKFFPAEPAGGVAYLEALASPLPEARFCPTGGIDAPKARAYLSLSSVLCVGGSWVAPKDALAAGDWPRITALARAAAALGGSTE
ncbi:MAG TPA: bifunctional 4-hydroxy-2-oxoglutarate aldolase/2-dehydro-3-deoxy-phosphogluconate aldolase [Geminicoccaceae bacterium]|nr:bifunctional 4-hydroxy-2-oxoglutarate aldolase/2-dehydro-3-deoxy-phosphogluconate aldolase [Geminicoccaceae bacterium]